MCSTAGPNKHRTGVIVDMTTCFKNDGDIQLIIQIAEAFNNLLNDSYIWISEINESLSPAKNSKEKKDIIGIPKTPSQLRGRKTRAAKKRRSSFLLRTAIKSSVHKRNVKESLEQEVLGANVEDNTETNKKDNVIQAKINNNKSRNTRSKISSSASSIRLSNQDDDCEVRSVKEKTDCMEKENSKDCKELHTVDFNKDIKDDDKLNHQIMENVTKNMLLRPSSNEAHFRNKNTETKAIMKTADARLENVFLQKDSYATLKSEIKDNIDIPNVGLDSLEEATFMSQKPNAISSSILENDAGILVNLQQSSNTNLQRDSNHEDVLNALGEHNDGESELKPDWEAIGSKKEDILVCQAVEESSWSFKNQSCNVGFKIIEENGTNKEDLKSSGSKQIKKKESSQSKGKKVKVSQNSSRCGKTLARQASHLSYPPKDASYGYSTDILQLKLQQEELGEKVHKFFKSNLCAPNFFKVPTPFTSSNIIKEEAPSLSKKETSEPRCQKPTDSSPNTSENTSEDFAFDLSPPPQFAYSEDIADTHTTPLVLNDGLRECEMPILSLNDIHNECNSPVKNKSVREMLIADVDGCIDIRSRKSHAEDANKLQIFESCESIPVSRDSGFASRSSRDARQSMKSICYADKPLIQTINESVIFNHEGNMPSLTSFNTLQLCEDSTLSGAFSKLDQSVSPKSVRDNIEQLNKTPVCQQSVSQKIVKDDVEHFNRTQVFCQRISSNIAKENVGQPNNTQVSIESGMHHTLSFSSPLSETSNPVHKEQYEVIEQDNLKNISPGKNDNLSVKNEGMLLSGPTLSSSNNVFETFNSIHSNEKCFFLSPSSKVLKKERGKLFAPITSSPSDVFSSLAMQIPTYPTSQNSEKILTTFTANYSPASMTVSPKHGMDIGMKKFSDFLFSEDPPLKNKSPIKINPTSFSERVFCKSNLKPVFSSNQRAPIKCSLFNNGVKIPPVNIAGVKASLNPSTQLIAKNIFATGVAEDNKLSPTETTCSIEGGKGEEPSAYKDFSKEPIISADGSPARSLFSNIKNSCKKMLSVKKSPSPNSKDSDKKSFWPISPKTPVPVVCDMGRVVSGSDLEISSPLMRERKPSIIVCDSPYIRNSAGVSLKETISDEVFLPPFDRRTPKTQVLRTLENKAINKSGRKIETSGVQIKSKKSVTLKVGFPWKKNKRRSSRTSGQKLSSDSKKVSQVVQQNQTRHFDKELDDIASTYNTGDSPENLEEVYISNLSILNPSKNLNATYLVPSNEKTCTPKISATQGVLADFTSSQKARITSEAHVNFPVHRSVLSVNNSTDKCIIPQRKSGVKRHSSAAGLDEGQATALKYMRVSDQCKNEGLIEKGSSIQEDDEPMYHRIPLELIDQEKSKSQHLQFSHQQFQPISLDNHPVIENSDIPLNEHSSVKNISRTAAIRDRLKQFFLPGNACKKPTVVSTPSTHALPQRVATQFPSSAQSNSSSHSRTLSKYSSMKNSALSSLFKSKTSTKLPKRTGYESETSEGSATCSTDSKSISSKQMLTSKQPLSYLTVKRAPSSTKPTSTEKFIDKKQRLEEADRRKAEQKLKKAEEARRKREERQLVVEQRKKEQEEKERQHHAAMAQKMDEKAKVALKITQEREREEKEKQKLREKRAQEAEQRRRHEEELKAQAQLLQEKEKEKQEDANRRQRELEAQEKSQKMAEIRKIEDAKRMGTEKERKDAKDKFKIDIEKTSVQKRLEEEKAKREIEKKIQMHNKKLASSHLKKGNSASEINRKMPKNYNPDNYDISKIKFGDGTDDEDNPRKQVPKWATEPFLSEAVYMQLLNPPDLDKIFDLQFSINLVDTFNNRVKTRYFKRTSSAHWETAPATHNISMYRS